MSNDEDEGLMGQFLVES
ncbi:MAG: hypothetical protein ACO3C1_13445 [Ilumatobacteraceae bacterium]